MFTGLRNSVCGFIIFILVFQMTACGTILYPERRGQTGGHIDPGIAILDGIGLLIFLIPGLFAFAIDFTTGAIYLPETSSSSLETPHLKAVRFDPAKTSKEEIEMIIKLETGYDVDLNRDNVQVFRLNTTEDMLKRFAEILAQIERRAI